MAALRDDFSGGDRRVAALWDGLGRVMDPELDESVVDLGFVTGVAIDGHGRVDVGFRLPTYWCSPNFAFLMADDMVRELGRLPFVREVRPHLEDHMSSREVNDGARRGLSFAEAFGGFEVSGTLEDLRETFSRKAFQRRQEAVILGMRLAGASDAAIVATDLATLERIVPIDAEFGRQKPRYLEILRARRLAERPDDRAIVSLDGAPIAADGLPAHLRSLRAVRINMEANGALCRGLFEARYPGGAAPLDAVPASRGCATQQAGAGCGGCTHHGAPGV